MIQKIKSYLLPLVMLLSFAAPLAVPLSVSACTSGIADQVASGASQAAQAGTTNDSTIDCGASKVGTSDIGKLASSVVKIFSIIVGAVAVIMLIYGGFRYITSGGDSGRVGNAKNTLLYAIIGLVIVALAQLIVHFVLNQSDNITTGTAVQ